VSAVLAAIVTLVGTLMLGFLGYWQWARAQSSANIKEYRVKRVETLAAIWEMLKGIEEEQRTVLHSRKRSMHLHELRQDHMRTVNLLLLKSAPFLLEDERDWAVTMMQSIQEIDVAVRYSLRSGRPGDDTEWWSETRRIGPETAIAAKEGKKLFEASEALGSRYAEVMRGEHE
jgi:hypothetical protein